jgi:hypothetical protein
MISILRESPEQFATNVLVLTTARNAATPQKAVVASTFVQHLERSVS